MRLLVCGGRYFSDYAFLDMCLRMVNEKRAIETIIHGAASGADSLADRWARENYINSVAVPAMWKEHGKSAGPKRNQEMLDTHHPDGVVAFSGGAGTADMVRRAKAAGIKVWQPST